MTQGRQGVVQRRAACGGSRECCAEIVTATRFCLRTHPLACWLEGGSIRFRIYSLVPLELTLGDAPRGDVDAVQEPERPRPVLRVPRLAAEERELEVRLLRRVAVVDSEVERPRLRKAPEAASAEGAQRGGGGGSFLVPPWFLPWNLPGSVWF